MIKKLYRSHSNRKLAGVLGGLAEYFSIDSIIPRLGYAALTLATGIGPGIVLYLIAAYLIPESTHSDASYTMHTEPPAPAPPHDSVHDDTDL
jgi:phage shock protein C